MERGGGRERGRAPFAHKDVRESGVACTTHPNKVGAVTSGFEVLCHTGHIYGDALEPSDRVLGIVDLWDHVLNVHVWESSNTPIAPQTPPQCQQQPAQARAPIQTHRRRLPRTLTNGGSTRLDRTARWTANLVHVESIELEGLRLDQPVKIRCRHVRVGGVAAVVTKLGPALQHNKRAPVSLVVTIRMVMKRHARLLFDRLTRSSASMWTMFFSVLEPAPADSKRRSGRAALILREARLIKI